ncbi:MAG: sugar ABC transporter permease [Ruminococcaceae bacterium]|nr:sugar ABC transporter permease [Oscillospiraceae bacterium]
MTTNQKRQTIRWIAFALSLLVVVCGIWLLSSVLASDIEASAPQFGNTNFTGLSESFDSDGYFVMTADDYLHEIKGGEVIRSTLISKVAEDSAELMKVIPINETRILVCSRSYVYLLDLQQGADGKSEWKQKDAAQVYYYSGPALYDFRENAEGNVELYFALNNTNGQNINLEKLTVKGDQLITGEVYGEILKTSGKNALTTMKTKVKALSISADGESILIAYENGQIMKIRIENDDAFHEFLNLQSGREDRAAYDAYGVEVTNFNDTIKGADGHPGQGVLYLTLQNAREVAMIDSNLEKTTLGKTDVVLDRVHFSGSENRLYLQSNDENIMHCFDLEAGNFSSKVTTVFNVDAWAVSSGTNEFAVYWRSPTGAERYLSAYKLDALGSVGGTGAYIAVLCVTVIAGILALYFLFAVITGDKAFKWVKSTLSKIWKGKWCYLVLLPSFALLVMFALYPSFMTIKDAFYQHIEGQPYIFIGFDNFKVLFESSFWPEMIRNTILFMICDIFVGIVPPVFFAYSIKLMRSKKTVQRVRLFMYLPSILVGISSLLVWRYGIYGANGMLNQFIRSVGGDTVSFLGTNETAIWSILVIGFPWVGGFLLFYGALMGIPQEIYDAVELEGITLPKRFITIELPFIMGQVRYVMIGQIIAAVQTVGRIWGTTKGTYGTMTPMFKVYDYLYNQQDYGKASAVAVLMLLVLSGITYFRLKKMLKGDQSYG